MLEAQLPHQQPSNFSQEFLSLLPKDTSEIDWADRTILRYYWMVDHAQHHEIRDILVYQLLATIIRDDETCFYYFETSPFSPEIWRQRLLKRLEWEIKEFSSLGPKYKRITTLLNEAKDSIAVQNWEQQLPDYQTSTWKRVRDTIASIGEVKAILAQYAEMDQKSEPFFKQFVSWTQEQGYR